MKNFAVSAAMLLALSAPVLGQPAADAPAGPPAAATPGTAAPAGKTFSVQTSTIGELLDNPAAHAVFAKYLPDVVSNPQLDQGRAMTLPDIVQYVPDLTPDQLAAIDAELKAIPPQ